MQTDAQTLAAELDGFTHRLPSPPQVVLEVHEAPSLSARA
jgi:hypothetical protein